MIIKVGDRVRIWHGLVEGIVVDEMGFGRYYVAWDDGCYSVVHLWDIEKVN